MSKRDEILSLCLLLVIIGFVLLFLLKIAKYQKNRKYDPNIGNKNFVPSKLTFFEELKRTAVYGGIIILTVSTIGFLFFIIFIFFAK